MRTQFKTLVVGSVLFGAAACADLDVVNPNDADTGRALTTAGDVEALVAGAYNTWFNGVYSNGGPGLFLSNASFQHTAPWANFGMEQYGRIPRIAIINDPADGVYGNFTRPWYRSYRAIAAISDGLRAMEDPDIAADIGAANLARDKAFAKFVLGVSHASVAVLYDQGFIVDDQTDLNEAQDAVDYNTLMEAAMGYFDEAIALSGQSSFTLPFGWLQDDVTSAELARIAHSMKARFRAAAARTPAERAAVDWAKVIADIDAGITSSWMPFQDGNNGWYNSVVDYGSADGWSQLPYWVYGMADQSGSYQRWLDLSIATKDPNPASGPILIVTSDTRFPQGATVDDQRANPGSYWTAPSNIAGVWARPDRGTWRWSYYYNDRNAAYHDTGAEDYPEIDLSEMNLLKAEGLYRSGDKAGAATLVNMTRAANGLNATDAAGTNSSCVPKLPNGQCGDLLEMLKWEKRMEINMHGLYGAPWYFDSRGWGDLFYGTPLQFPAPCQELQVLNILPCYTFGGSDGEMSSPGSTYAYPHEK